jgi:hypothetical protein
MIVSNFLVERFSELSIKLSPSIRGCHHDASPLQPAGLPRRPVRVPCNELPTSGGSSVFESRLPHAVPQTDPPTCVTNPNCGVRGRQHKASFVTIGAEEEDRGAPPGADMVFVIRHAERLDREVSGSAPRPQFVRMMATVTTHALSLCLRPPSLLGRRPGGATRLFVPKVISDGSAWRPCGVWLQ